MDIRAPKATQKYATKLEQGDPVAFACNSIQIIGVVKGYGKAGNFQVEFPDYKGILKVKGIPIKDDNRIVRVDIKDLNPELQKTIKEISDKYKV